MLKVVKKDDVYRLSEAEIKKALIHLKKIHGEFVETALNNYLVEDGMEVGCYFCVSCDSLWDKKDIENGLCFDCQGPVIKMFARQVK